MVSCRTAVLLAAFATTPAAAQDPARPVTPAADWTTAIGYMAPGDRPCVVERELLRTEMTTAGILRELMLESLEKCVHDNAVAMMEARARQAAR